MPGFWIITWPHQQFDRLSCLPEFHYYIYLFIITLYPYDAFGNYFVHYIKICSPIQGCTPCFWFGYMTTPVFWPLAMLTRIPLLYKPTTSISYPYHITTILLSEYKASKYHVIVYLAYNTIHCSSFFADVTACRHRVQWPQASCNSCVTTKFLAKQCLYCRDINHTLVMDRNIQPHWLHNYIENYSSWRYVNVRRGAGLQWNLSLSLDIWTTYKYNILSVTDNIHPELSHREICILSNKFHLSRFLQSSSLS